MVEVIAYVAAAVLAGFGGYRVLLARGSGTDPAQRYVCGFALCLGVSFVLLTPATLAWLDAVLPGVVVELAGDSVKTAGLSFLALLALSLTNETPYAPGGVAAGPGPGPVRPDLRHHVLVAIAVQLVSAVLLLGADPSMRGGSMAVHGPAARILLSSYDALFTCYAIWCLLVLTRVIVPHMRRAGPGPLRFGLELTTAAIVVGALWTAWSLDDVADVLAGGVQDGGEDTLSNVLGVICAVLTVSGATATLWGTRLATPLRWLRAHRRHRALEPLWSALHAELPEIALAPGRPSRRLPPWRAEFALYRRIIEIHDAALALRPYHDPHVASWIADRDPAGPGGAVVEAAVLAAALENRRHGRRHVDDPDAGHPAPTLPGTIDAEALWLVQVAEAFRASPVTAYVRGQAARTALTGAVRED
ncbi:MAB_1171c family putative transporter [Streptantibioticus parmotrematis]|uniref:MAB_1171c family putative transporter n=1 Tax=Streptantibioticus parmotrematis TaxID=2873249 RepID=UPI0034029F8A